MSQSVPVDVSPGSPRRPDAPSASDRGPADAAGGAAPATFWRRLACGPRVASLRLAPWWRRFPDNRFLWLLLLLITAGAAFLRFWRLDHQGYWYDEARTIERIYDSLEHLVKTLNKQGFPPGWYVLLRAWADVVERWTGSGVTAFAPAALRALPAIFGTLTVPAMYLLARQFTDRKGALLVMLIAAVNPYLIYYSRDIKMYAACWFFVTLNVAFYLKWLTTCRHWLWWPLFMLSGVAMVAMHASAWFVVGVELVWLLTRPRLKSLEAPLWLLAVALMSLLPIYWYQNHSEWVARAAAGEPDQGLDWIRDYTDMSWTTVASLPCSHLLGYLWPEWPVSARTQDWFRLGSGPTGFKANLATRTVPWLIGWEEWVAIGVGAVMVLGLIPWRGRRCSIERDLSATRHRGWWLATWIALPILLMAATWIGRDNAWYPATWGLVEKLNGKRIDVQPLWEPRYLGVIVPAWILWLAASLRRLPTAPLRGVLIAAVLAAGTVSSLSNHLIYRQAPWSRTADVLKTYFDPKTARSIALGTPSTHFPGDADTYEYQLVMGKRPGLTNLNYMLPLRWNHCAKELVDVEQPQQPSPGKEPPIAYTEFLHNMAADASVKTIIMTDRLGDLATGPLTDGAVAKLLGPRWQLVREEQYNWYYEWRFYFFNTWRTRVWVRK